MFERFTDEARQVVALAQDEAKMLDHDYIGTEHLLLGLLHEGQGVAAQALASLEISLEAVRQQVGEMIGQGRQTRAGLMPFTPRAKKVLELSLREALQLGHHGIDTEHILLALIREGKGVAAQVLVKLGADLRQVRRQVLQLVAASRGEEKPESAPGAALPGAALPGAGGHPEGKAAAEILGRVESIDLRLSAVEQRVGTGPDLADLDQAITQARRDKEAAVDAEDYENAAVLRDLERQLLAEQASRQRAWAAAQPDLPSLARELHRLRDEVERLRGLLGQRGTGPRGGAA